MSSTMLIGVALSKIVLRAGGQGDLATSLGDGKDAVTSLLTILRRPAGFDGVTQRIAAQLDHFLTVEFRQADEGDRAAAISEADKIIRVALTDEQRLVDAVIDPVRLREYLDVSGASAVKASLGGESGRIFDLLIDWSVDWIAGHANSSTVFNKAATTHLVREVDKLTAITSEATENVTALRQTVQALTTRAHLNPLASDEVARYTGVVEALAPPFLLGRTRELALLADFALSGPGQWLGFEGGAQAGKTALLSTFFLTPPHDVIVVPFFVRSDQATANDRDSFLARVLPNLAHLSGLESATVDLNATRAEDSFQRLLESAAKKCSEQGFTLLLLIDALDEDAYNIDRSRIKPSIAGILPPNLPAGVRVVVSTRPNPPLPADVVEDGRGIGHPLRDRKMWRTLDNSSHASAAFSIDDVHDLMQVQPGKDIAAFLAASGGQLTFPDLVELTGGDASTINRVFTTSTGRLLLPDRSECSVSYSLGHVRITQMVLSILEPRLLESGMPDPDDSASWNDVSRRVLDPWRVRINSWAKGYASRGWPRETPSYLLDDAYIALLTDNRDFHPDLVSTLTSESRIDCLFKRHEDTHYPTITQLRRATTRLIEEASNESRSADLYLVGKLVAVQSQLATHKGRVPVKLPAVFGALGRHTHASKLALSIPKASDRLEALTQLIGALVRTNQQVEAFEVLDLAESVLAVIVDSKEKLQAQQQIIVALTEMGRIADALSMAETVDSAATQTLIFSELTRVLVAAGNLGNARHLAIKSKKAADRVSKAHSQECTAAAALALAEVGMAKEASEAAGKALTQAESIASEAFRARVLGIIAVAYDRAGHPHQAEKIAKRALYTASRIGNSNTRGRARAGVAQRFVELGLTKEALAVAAGISDRIGRARALATVAHALAVKGQMTEAYETAQAARKEAADIDKPGARARVLAGAALTLTMSGHLNEAEKAALEADTAAVDTANARPRASTQAEAALAIDIAGHGFKSLSALHVARSIADGEDRVSTLAQVAKVLALSQPRAAYDAAFEASAQARAIASLRNREHALVAVAGAFGAIGSISDARIAVGTIGTPGTRVRGMVSVAEALADLGLREDAYLAITEARGYASSIDHPDAMAYTHSSISQTLSALGIGGEAISAAMDARESANSIVDATGRAVALSQAALAFSAAGDVGEASTTADQAYNCATGVSSRRDRAIALAHAAQALAGAGRDDESRAVAFAARDEAMRVRSNSQRPAAVQQAAQALAITGRIAEANKTAASISNYQGRAKAFAQIAEVLARAGRMGEASNALAFSWLAAGTLLESWPVLLRIRPDVAHRLLAEGLVKT